jgi:hypothetical protein
MGSKAYMGANVLLGPWLHFLGAASPLTSETGSDIMYVPK